VANGESKLGIGICGLGFMGRNQFWYWREHPQARLAAVCDHDPARRAGDWQDEIGNITPNTGGHVDMSGISAYARVADLLKDDAVDVVAITLPTPLHADATVRALRAGKHVFCEKPMARTLRECDRMIRAAEQTGRTLMVGQCIRFWPQYEAIKRMVDAGEAGQVRCLSLRRLSSPPLWSDGGWLMDAKKSGGALLDLHVHDVDFAQYMLGVPQRVYACGGVGPSGGIDHIVATYTYPDGRYAVIEGGWAFQAPWPFEMAITVQGTTGTLEWSSLRGPEVLHYAGGDEPRRVAVSDRGGWLAELDYFIDCVLAGQPVTRCPPSSSRTSIALAFLEQRSIKRARAVAVPATLRTGE
jgi:1,5-anhydro-D-fructose reductase (1,5-anhydro-D-mannitol-forming)